jgi:molybdopterin converting factor small subunit
MRVTIRLFGRLHALAGASVLDREIEAPATAADVWQVLAGETPAIAPYARSVSVAVNADFARLTTRLEEGDEVAFLPPVSGG